MQMCTRARTIILLAVFGQATGGVALAQAQAVTEPRGERFTAPDQSASAIVPAGWRVTSAAQTVIKMEGPNGTKLVLGNTIIARDATFEAGRTAPAGIDIQMPYSAPLDQKLSMLVQQGIAKSQSGIDQFTVQSETPLALPAAVGQCARFVASYRTDKGPEKMMAVLCSLPIDGRANYKNIVLSATAPAATAADEAAAASAIFRSYTIPPSWLQRKLAPVDVAVTPSLPSVGATTGYVPNSIGAAPAIDHSVNCFDLSILRNTPDWKLPTSCGGSGPG